MKKTGSYIGGKRYDAMIKCLEFRGKFTAYDTGFHPSTIKTLAERGFLLIVEKRRSYPARPYSYRVPDRVRKRFE